MANPGKDNKQTTASCESAPISTHSGPGGRVRSPYEEAAIERSDIYGSQDGGSEVSPPAQGAYNREPLCMCTPVPSGLPQYGPTPV